MKKSSLPGVCAFAAAFVLAGVSASAQSTNPYNPLPTRILGQSRVTPVTNGNPNYVQGSEMFSPLAVAYDATSSPPVLYIADSFNNRVLAYKNPAAVKPGAAADLIIGQLDPYSTIPQGPANNTSTRISEGFYVPSALAVDAQGNLYIADYGNNRILRYPRPFDQQSTVLQADLVIGQSDLRSGSSANRGFNNPSNTTLSLQNFHMGMAFDPKTGDLWVSDPGNNRVLRFPSNQLAPYTQDPAADVVLGQNDMNTGGFSFGTDSSQLNKNVLANPSGITFDAAGRLYVCDNLARVLVFKPPFFPATNTAARILGAVVPTNQPVSASKLGGTASSSFAPPEGVFAIGNNIFVVDSPNSRIVGYDPYDTWAAETPTTPSPAATLVVGQGNFQGFLPNRGSKTDASFSSFSGPVAAIFSGTDVWVADTNNNRVVGLPVSGTSFGTANKLLGQTDYYQSGVNHVDANGFFFSSARTLGGGVAVDYSSNPPRLYLADPGNNRVLGYPDARNVKAGDPAAIVIGQLDFQHAAINIPSGDTLQTSDVGLYSPAGVAVDRNGDLWVADSGNGRVVRFPSPFKVTTGQQRANLVLGQLALYTQPQTDQATATQMKNPWGIAFLFDGSVFVSDPASNRVLLFRKPDGGDFRNGQPATGVYGQRDFTSSASGNTLDKLNGPRFISTDTDDRLYVADTGNNRITIYRQQSTQQPSGFPATSTIDGLSGPVGVQVSPLSGYIWVANSNGNTALRYPSFLDYQLNPTAPPDILQSINPIFIALDPLDNPIVTEAINRISFYYPRLNFQSAANQSDRALAPGMVADLLLPQGAFAQDTTNNTTIPWPKSLADLEVIVAGVAAPITSVAPNKIRIQVPQSVPLGQADFVVQHSSNQQVIASATFTTDVAAPGFYVIGGNPGGAIVAKNADGTDNTPQQPATRGSVVSLFGTGIGLVANQPDDGTAASQKQDAADSIQSLVFTKTVTDLKGTIKYFGLAPGQVGTFQLDLVVPSFAVPFQPNPVAFSYKDLRSSQGPGGSTVISTIYVK